ncbi:MAG: ABC transporter permease [Gordonia polyisoprenivorans]|nr:ABC transporter permease [Gordonia polyisoprenivorans]
MVSFLIRRILASLVVLFVASYLVYNLAAVSGDPLSDLKQANIPSAQKTALINARIAELHLDLPPFIRYFLWLGGALGFVVGRFDLGSTIDGQAVTDLLSGAVGQTLQLVTGSLVIGLVIGVALGITTALRQYSGYDYGITFLAFLFFSLPVFVIAVMLKQFGAIGFNNFLSDPVIDPVWIVVLTLLSGVVWMVVLGGDLRRRLIVFGAAAVVTGALLVYISVSRWFANPGMGPVVTTVLSLGAAVLVTYLSTGWANKRARWTALSVAGLGLALYFPLSALFQQFAIINIWSVLLLIGIFSGLGGLAGYLWGGNDRRPQIRTGGLTGLLVILILLLDRFMASFTVYVDQVVNGRPISTVGASTPDLQASFWVVGIDTFMHLLLPTIGLVLASLAGYSRYARASLLDVMNQDYIRTARAKGLNERTVVMRHAFRNALIPITTVVALDFGALIGGAIVTERVYGWTGMGAIFNSALDKVDLNPIMGFFLVTAVAAILFNFFADVIYSALDPRIRVAA